MVTDTTVRDEAAVNGGADAAPLWWLGIFEKTLACYANPLAREGGVAAIDRALSAEPGPRLAWFPAVMANLARLPWGSSAWSSEDARPLSDGAVLRLLLLLQEFLPSGGPAPVISPTWDGGVQADWELGDLYLELEVVPDGATRYCFVDERGAEPVEEEFDLSGHEDELRAHMATVAAAASGNQ